MKGELKMLTVSYKDEDCLGSVIYSYEGIYYSCKIQKCNGLFAIVYFFTDGEGIDRVQLVDFANDTKHFERCLKEYGDRYNGSWCLNKEHKESIQIAKSLLKFKVGFQIL